MVFDPPYRKNKVDFLFFDRLRRKTYRLRHKYCIFHFNQYNEIKGNERRGCI